MAIIRSSIGFGADLVCPERCAGCDVLTDPSALFCEACLAAVHQLGPPECPGCGAPQPTEERCSGCARPDAPIRSARAWVAYDRGGAASPIAHAIARFKYRGARRLGRRFAAVMTPRTSPGDVTLIVPVPLHARRLRERGFNQSAVLARHLGRQLGCAVALAAVVRTRDTPSQVTTMAAAARNANVTGAFVVRDPAIVRGRDVLVVDDVWTSGATARAVARSLRDAGAAAVDVLTIARVL